MDDAGESCFAAALPPQGVIMRLAPTLSTGTLNDGEVGNRTKIEQTQHSTRKRDFRYCWQRHR